MYDRATDVDRDLLQLLRAMPRSAGYYSAYGGAPTGVLEGAVGLLALQQASATGRLFADAGGSTVGVPLRWGEPLPVAWEWKEAPAASYDDSDGSAWTLQARLPSPSATLCANHPPLYIDTDQGLCGPVQADGLRPAQLDLLLQAPPLAAAALQKHQTQVASRLGGVLPLPPVLKPLARVQDCKPVARLHLAPTLPHEVPDMGLITAQLQFDYAGHVGWWVGQDLAMLVPGADGSQVLLQRDGLSELNAIERLLGLGLLGTDEGLFGIPGERSQNDWMHWADNGFVVLRDAGFEVSLDAALEGWIQHADALEVALQPEGGDEAHRRGSLCRWASRSKVCVTTSCPGCPGSLPLRPTSRWTLPPACPSCPRTSICRPTPVRALCACPPTRCGRGWRRCSTWWATVRTTSTATA